MKLHVYKAFDEVQCIKDLDDKYIKGKIYRLIPAHSQGYMEHEDFNNLTYLTKCLGVDQGNGHTGSAYFIYHNRTYSHFTPVYKIVRSNKPAWF